MPRRKAATKRKILPDPLYGSEWLAKFINVVMRRGKKSVAEQIVYNALAEAKKRLKKDKHPTKKTESDEDEGSASGKKEKFDAANLEALEKALHNVRPTVEVKSRRVGGATYQVPIEVNAERGLALAMRMLANAAKARGEKTMVLRLAAEILDAHEGRGAAVKMRDDIHRMAKANQAFAHYRW
jgi:small subunit ribosomal protein S7